MESEIRGEFQCDRSCLENCYTLALNISLSCFKTFAGWFLSTLYNIIYPYSNIHHSIIIRLYFCSIILYIYILSAGAKTLLNEFSHTAVR